LKIKTEAAALAVTESVKNLYDNLTENKEKLHNKVYMNCPLTGNKSAV
jgi:hypothetical protein